MEVGKMKYKDRDSITISGNLVSVQFTVPPGSWIKKIKGSITDNSVFSVCDGDTVVNGKITDGTDIYNPKVKISAFNQTTNPMEYHISCDTEFHVKNEIFTLEFYTLISSYQGENEKMKVMYE